MDRDVEPRTEIELEPKKKPPFGRFNRILVGLGVVVFAGVVTHQVRDAFLDNDAGLSDSAEADIVSVVDAQSGSVDPVEGAPLQSDDNAKTLAGAHSENDPEAKLADSESSAVTNDNVPEDQKMAFEAFEGLLGSRVIFVASGDLGYVITEDERRFEIGEVFHEATSIASISAKQLTLNLDKGDVLVVNLPDPLVN